MKPKYQFNHGTIKFKVWVGKPDGKVDTKAYKGNQIFQNLEVTNYYGAYCKVKFNSKPQGKDQIRFRDVGTGLTQPVWDTVFDVKPKFNPVKPFPVKSAEIVRYKPRSISEYIDSKGGYKYRLSRKFKDFNNIFHKIDL